MISKLREDKRSFGSIFTASVVAFLLLSPIAVLAADAVAATVVPEKRQQELRHLLLHDCGSCHGMTLKGGLGPALLPETLKGKSVEFLVYTILEGRSNTAMPPWRGQLSEAEARWLAITLREGLKP